MERDRLVVAVARVARQVGGDRHVAQQHLALVAVAHEQQRVDGAVQAVVAAGLAALDQDDVLGPDGEEDRLAHRVRAKRRLVEH